MNDVNLLGAALILLLFGVCLWIAQKKRGGGW